MKKIINGKLYDTDTAEEIGSYSNNRSMGDFDYLEETLCRKKTGGFFFHGAGGARTRYSAPSGDGRSGGEGITPCTEEDAREWAERHISAGRYMEAFGPVAE